MKKQFNLTTPSGTQVWYLDTRDRSDDVLSGRIYVGDLHFHRTDGPAFIYSDVTQGWLLNDKHYRDNKSFQKAAKITDEEMVIMIIKYGNVK